MAWRAACLIIESSANWLCSHWLHVYWCVWPVCVCVVCGRRVRRCTQIKTYSWDNAQVVLVGNKCDLEYERVVSAERGRRLADQLGTYRQSTVTFNVHPSHAPRPSLSGPAFSRLLCRHTRQSRSVSSPTGNFADCNFSKVTPYTAII